MTALIVLFIYWLINIVIGAYYAGDRRTLTYTPGLVIFQALVYLAFGIWLWNSLL